MQDLDFWLGEVEALLTTDELGKDLASLQDHDFWLGEELALLTTDELGIRFWTEARSTLVQNLVKKHKLVEADIIAHEDRINDMNEQADSLVDSGQCDSADIKDKRDGITKRLVHALKCERISQQK